jgi:transcriptional regulator with XRE-family HTH domain
MMNLGKALKVALAMRGLNQSQLARQEGWNLRSLNKLANNQNGTVNNINKLSAALGMTPSEFVKLGED